MKRNGVVLLGEKYFPICILNKMALAKNIVDLPRSLRQTQTPEEKILWDNLRNRKLNGFKFLRQHPIVHGGTRSTTDFYIADFYCHEKRLVIELDGKVHDVQKDYDRERDAVLNQLGLTVVRFKNEEIKNLSAVLNEISKILSCLQSHNPHPTLQHNIIPLSSHSPTPHTSPTTPQPTPALTPTRPSLRSREGPSSDSVDEGELNVSVILLAAGSSSRMGQSKQLLEIDGKPLLLHSAKAAIASGASNVIVILGANEQPHREIIRELPLNIIVNHYWKSGMGSSIKAGLNYMIRKSSETAAVIIMVCDQPALTEHHLQELIREFKGTKSPIIASSYSGTSGVPALFARSFFSNILMLRDEEGAKKLIQQFPEQVRTVNFPEGVFDLDTSEDYENYLKRK